MAQILSNAHLEHIIDGHRVEGLANEDRPIEFPTGRGFNNIVRSDHDGGMYGTSLAMFGGPVIYRVTPNSPTCQWAIQRNQERKEAIKNASAIPTFADASHANLVANWSADLSGGVLQDCPDIPEAGVTFEFTIEWELIDSNVDGGVFTPPLQSP